MGNAVKPSVKRVSFYSYWASSPEQCHKVHVSIRWLQEPKVSCGCPMGMAFPSPSSEVYPPPPLAMGPPVVDIWSHMGHMRKKRYVLSHLRLHQPVGRQRCRGPVEGGTSDVSATELT